MNFADIHFHALSGSDDGAKTESDMFAIVDAAYAEGTRHLCLTPHYHPGYYGHNRERSGAAFETLTRYAKEKYPDLTLAIGNEIHYGSGCEHWLTDGECRTMNGTDYVLIDFSYGESARVIADALNRLLNTGYRPILAHAERYTDIRGDLAFIDDMRQNGVLIQLDADSLLGGFGPLAKRFCRAMLKRRLVDFISSDAHDVDKRPPLMRPAYDYIVKKHGQQYADAVCRDNALALIF